MAEDISSFRFAYEPGTIHYGSNSVDELAAELDRLDLYRALVVCGQTVGETQAVIEPVTEGLGNRLAGVFARTTPEKRLETAYAGVETMREVDADVLVSLGGGSSLDIAKVMSVLAVTDQPREEIISDLADRGGIAVPSKPLTPIVAIPTTLAGADLSTVGGVTVSPDASETIDEPVSGGVGDVRLMPTALFYDPDLFATTPEDVLTASAMNGFDKGIETLYAENATPITDATATRGLRMLREGLPSLGRGKRDARTLEQVITGIVLVQYGISRPDGTTLSVIHAFGHGLSQNYAIQQGNAHAIVAPHVLRYLFEHVTARREALAAALGIRDEGTTTGVATEIVGVVAEIRDALGLPSQLRTIEGLTRDELPTVADAILNDGLMRNAPAGLDPTTDELEVVLRRAW